MNPIHPEAVRCLNDNFCWLVPAPKGLIVVDPGEAEPVEKARRDRPVAAILLTHHHSDHTGGAASVQKMSGAPILGSARTLQSVSGTGEKEILHGGESLDAGGLELKVLDAPGHALGHQLYYFPALKALFTGDTLFNGGCGRIFEGTPAELFESLQQCRALPPDTRVYPGHNYNRGNLAFIASLGPLSEAQLQWRRASEAAEKAGKNPPVLTMAEEEAVNPFLQAPDLRHFTALRQAKDAFRG